MGIFLDCMESKVIARHVPVFNVIGAKGFRNIISQGKLADICSCIS